MNLIHRLLINKFLSVVTWVPRWILSWVCHWSKRLHDSVFALI